MRPLPRMTAALAAVVLALLVLAACGGAPAVTAQQVIDRFAAANLEASNPHQPQFKEGSPFPRSFTDGISFDLPSLGATSTGEARHGAVLVCDTKKNCDAIYAYLDALKGLLGPYYYQSPSGTVVVTLDSKMDAPTAAKYEAIVKALP
jgi:hypothetical protein